MKLRTNDVVTTSLGDEMVILNTHSSQYLTASGVGIRLMELLVVERTESDLVDSLLDEYDVEPTVVRKDVASFLSDLRSAGLIEG